MSAKDFAFTLQRARGVIKLHGKWFGTCAAVGTAGFDAGIETNGVANVLFDLVGEGFVFFDREFFELLTVFDAEVDHGADDVMRFTEGKAFFREIVRQIRRIGVTESRSIPHDCCRPWESPSSW